MARTYLGFVLGLLSVTGALSLGTTVIDGDVYIQLMASIYKDMHENGTCYNVDSESVQGVEAVRWVLTQLNGGNNYFPWGQKGVGLRVSPTCGSQANALNIAFDLSEELKKPDSNVVGLLGPEYSSEAETVSRLLSALPEQYRLLQMSYTATSASLRNRDIFKNFFRTIPPDDVQAQIANLGSTGMEVFFNQIKDYDSNGNELTWPDIRKPQCPSTYICISCLSYTRTDTSVFYMPGDMYVVGVVPVHNPGSTPLQCGSIKSGALDIVEVIRFAVSDARDIYAGIIPTGDIGIVIIDSCNDPHIIQEKLLTLLRNGVFKDGVYIPVADKIIGYIGGWSSSVSTVMAGITSRTDYVQISYASTATSLSDRQRFPYFMRTPTPDNFQADTMLKIVNYFDSNLVQIVYSDGTYGEEGRATLLSLVDHNKICVAGVHSVTDNTDSTELVTSLRKFASARIILFFVSSFHADIHVKKMNDLLLPGEFIFIASEAWGTRLNLTGYSNLIGSITLTSEMSINEKFKDHMKELMPDGSNSDPWIREYMEKVFQCYYQWSYDKESGKPCSGTERLNVFTTDYRIDAWSPFTEIAVIALLQGAKLALDDQCGGSAAVCDAFKNNPSILFDFTKELEFTGQSGVVKSRVFNDNGDGAAGYKIYAVGISGQYVLVGSSELNGEETDINFQKGSYPGPSNINSSCTDSSAICQECFPSPIVAADTSECLSNGLIVVIVILAIGCCVLAGILLFVCNRLGCCFRLENGKPTLNQNYITPVYLQRQATGSHVTGPPEHYDSIDDMYNNKSRSGGSDNSYSRQPQVVDRTDGMNPHLSDGSFLSSGSSKSGSRMDSANSKGSYVGHMPSAHAQPGSGGGNVQINQDTGVQKVVYQQDGSYITASGRDMGYNPASDQENRGFERGVDDKRLSDQSVRLPSADSDKSLGYLRSVQTVNMNGEA